jgi:hypothetical protein
MKLSERHIRFGEVMASNKKRINAVSEANRVGKRRTHGLRYSAEYDIWRGIKKRCADSSLQNYGGRGISVCKEWEDSFESFYRDMGPRPSPRHSIDRFPDKDGNYEPCNCRWATCTEQQRNRRNNVLVEWNGEVRTLVEWAGVVPIPICTLYWRISRAKWPAARAFTEPVSKGRR